MGAMSDPRPAGAVTVTIDRLTVDGLDAPSARRLGAALQGRLAALIAERGLPEGLSADAPAEVPALELDGQNLSSSGGIERPDHLGRALAESLYQRLDRERLEGEGRR